MLVNTPLTSPASSVNGDYEINRSTTVANFSLSRISPAKTFEEKIGLPPKPKKPLTPYFRYMAQQRPKLQAANPKTSIIEIVKQISKEWEKVDASMKERLQAEYKKDQQTYIEARTKYDAKITDEQRAQLKELKQEVTEAKERRMMRKRVKELGRPKKPASAFLQFVAKQRIVTPRSPKETYQNWQRTVTDKWLTLSDEEKSVYIMEARKELEKYK